MAFKKAREYKEQIHAGKFILPDDGDSANVIFLYKNYDDVLLADVHYIKSAEYSGFVQCTGRDCPACAKGIRVQNKLFIPVYNVDEQEVQFWDRGERFESQLSRDVFRKYPNPTGYVFRVTRKGEANDRNTRYTIEVSGKNSSLSYEQLLEKFNVSFPEAYENICKDYDADKLRDLLAHPADAVSDNDLPDYSVTPRASANGMPTPVYEPVPEDTALTFDADADSDPDGDLDEVSF